MLTDVQIRELCGKMSIPLAREGIIFKSETPKVLEKNKAYFLNLEDEYDSSGHLNSGSHWTCFVIMKTPNGTLQPLYFDAYGIGPPEIVKTIMMKNAKQKIPFNTKDIQSLMSNACGWYCLAFMHFIFNFSHRSGDLYEDTELFLSYFDDLNKTTNFLKNEYILKQFFVAKDPALRRKITTVADVDSITEDTNGGVDPFHPSGIKVSMEI
jgi:hypothetical protein